MLEVLIGLASEIRDSGLKSIVLNIISNPKLTFTSVEPLISLVESPAAPRKHHAFSGGLLVHTVSVVRIALAIASIFEEVYGVKANRDLIIAAAILHDIYKYYQYDRDGVNGGFKPRYDWYLSHDYAVVAEIARRGGGDDLLRVVSEVHGTAPIATLEGLIVHLADSIDARFGEHLQNEVISYARDSGFEERGCKPLQLLDNAIRVLGVATVLQHARNREKLHEILAALCSEAESSGLK